jgi:hypothetical protein
MHQTERRADIPEILSEVAADFELCGRRAVECILNRPTLLEKAFSLQARASDGPLLRTFVASANGGYSLTITLGLERSGLLELFPRENDGGEMALDAIGEVVNVLAGCLFARPGFHSRFGCMRASVPSIAPDGAGPGTSWSLSGTLLVESIKLHLELAVQSQGSGD